MARMKDKMNLLDTVADGQGKEARTGHSSAYDDCDTQLIESPHSDSGGDSEENDGGDTLPLENTGLFENTLPFENTVLLETQLVDEDKYQEKRQLLEELHADGNPMDAAGIKNCHVGVDTDTKTQLLEEFHEDNDLGGLTDRKGFDIVADSEDEHSGETEVLSEEGGESDGKTSSHRTDEFKCGQFVRQAVPAHNHFHGEGSPQINLSNTVKTALFRGSSQCENYHQFAVDSDASTEDTSDSDQPQKPRDLYFNSCAEANIDCQGSAKGIFAHEARKAASRIELRQSAIKMSSQMNNTKAFNEEPDPKRENDGHRSSGVLKSDVLDSPEAIEGVAIDKQMEMNVTLGSITRATMDNSPSSSLMPTSGSRSIAAVRAASLRASGLRASGRLAAANAGTRVQAGQDLSFSKSEVTRKHDSGLLLVPGMSMAIQAGKKIPVAARSPQPDMASDKVGASSVVDKSLLKHTPLEVMGQNEAEDQKEIENVCYEAPSYSRQVTRFRSENLKARKLFPDAKIKEDDKPRARDDNEEGVGPRAEDGKEEDREPRTMDFNEQDDGPRISIDNEECDKARLDNEEDDILKKEGFNIVSSKELKPARLEDIRFGKKLQCLPVSAGLSYLNSQEPGEESQMDALNVVDKLVWLNTTGLSQDPEPERLPEVSTTGLPSARGPQNLAQMVESKNPKENIGVFDWVDSPHDESAGQFFSKNGLGVLASRSRRGKFETQSKQIDCMSYRGKKGFSRLHNSKDDKVGKDKSKILLCGLQKLSSSVALGTKLPMASNLPHGIENKMEINAQGVNDSLTKVANQSEPADTPRYSKRLQLGKEKNLDMKNRNAADEQNARGEKLPLNSGKLSNQQLEKSPSCRDSLGMSDIGSDTQLAAEAMQIMVCGAFSNQITEESTYKAEQRDRANLRQARKRNSSVSGPVTSEESKSRGLKKRTLSSTDSENGRNGRRRSTAANSVAADCSARANSKRVHWEEDEGKSQKKGKGRRVGKLGYSNDVDKQKLEFQTNSMSSEIEEQKWDMLKDSVNVARRKRKRAIAEDTLCNPGGSKGTDNSSKLAAVQSTGAAVEGVQLKAGSALVHLTRQAKRLKQVEKQKYETWTDSRRSQANEKKHNLLKGSTKVVRSTRKQPNVEDTPGNVSNSRGSDHSSKSAGAVQSTGVAVEGMCPKADAGVVCASRQAINLEEEEKQKLDTQTCLKSSEGKGKEQDLLKNAVTIVRRKRKQGKPEDALCKQSTDHSSKPGGEVPSTVEDVEGTFLKGRKASMLSTRRAKDREQDENLKFEIQTGFNSSETKDVKADMLKGFVKTVRRKGKQANAEDNLCKPIRSMHVECVSKPVGEVSSTGAAEGGMCLMVGEAAARLTRQATHNVGAVVGSAACALTGIDGDKSALNEIITEPRLQRQKSRRRSATFATPNGQTLSNAASLRSSIEDEVQLNNTSVGAKSPQTPVNDISVKSPASSGHGLETSDSSKKGLHKKGTPRSTSVGAKSPQTPVNDISVKSPASSGHGLETSDSSKKGLHKKGTPRSTLKRELDRLAATEACQSPILKDSVRRKREPGSVCVLFSHGLDDDIIKQQRKVLARLGGQVTASPADCTHFVTDKFARTRNMLEAMAAGKPVVTYLWLENCGQASYFIDEKKYILEDAKKEKEIGFSMSVSLASAQQRPLLQGRQVFISPNTKPDRESIVALVKAAKGQVLDSCRGAFSKKRENMENLIVISCEEDYRICISLLEKGAKVYSPELLLNGIVVQSLDFSRDQLFTDHVKRMRSSNTQLRQQS